MQTLKTMISLTFPKPDAFMFPKAVISFMVPKAVIPLNSDTPHFSKAVIPLTFPKKYIQIKQYHIIHIINHTRKNQKKFKKYNLPYIKNICT